ncbi:sugar phosphate nucleotidyltransferase [Niallia taxi]|uniref:sugar phosphate nucleotidyltransferase n=1 Tax=Niallia taxi TaxID=2499688 RepID=UPI003981E472
MKLVLLSGGSGKRLWPLSNDSRSKQFLKVLKNDNGIGQSMVQRVWEQLVKNQLDRDSVIATSKSQVDMIYSQLGSNIPVIIEPERRDTFPAIALAAAYLYSIERCGPEEVVAMLPVDPYVEDHFFSTVKRLEKALIESDGDIALIGVKPTYPSEKYGYIVPNRLSKDESDYYNIETFKEKPKQKVALDLIGKNALWNCGVFAFRLKYVLEILEKMKLPVQFDQLLKQYHLLPKNSFDYEVVEKANHIIAVPYEGYWKDLGTWNTLTEEIAQQVNGKGYISTEVNNSHIINELDIPITLIGLQNVVVAASPDGILVTDKESSPRVKEIVKEIEGRPMYEERRWGWYKVLEHTKFPEGNEVLTKRICIEQGKNLSYQIHYKRSEIWSVVKGEGVLVLNDQLRPIRAGDVVNIPLGMKHSVRATSTMEIIEVQTGSELIEEDTFRYELEWDKIMNIMMIPL